MKLQRVDELTEPPVVGRFYLVQCVRGKWSDRLGDWPVMGPLHSDAKFLNFPQRHYHLNRFFLTGDDAWYATGRPLGEFDPSMRPPGYPENDPLPEPVYRRRMCRSSPVEPFPTFSALTSTRVDFKAMLRHYAGRQCKRGAGWICPHKGLDLGPIAPGPDGHIMCPLHGLRVHAGTGVVASADSYTQES